MEGLVILVILFMIISSILSRLREAKRAAERRAVRPVPQPGPTFESGDLRGQPSARPSARASSPATDPEGGSAPGTGARVPTRLEEYPSGREAEQEVDLEGPPPRRRLDRAPSLEEILFGERTEPSRPAEPPARVAPREEPPPTEKKPDVPLRRVYRPYQRATASPEPKQEDRHRLIFPTTPSSARQAIVFSEILGPPRAERPYDF